MKIFNGTTNKPLAEKIAKILNLNLSSFEIHVFADEETRIRAVDRVLDEECLVIQNTATNADKNYMHLFFMIDALKRNGAKSVTAVLPYMGYSRQDHVFREGESVSLQVIIKIIETLKTDGIMVLDLHSSRITELFSIPVTHLSALPIFARTIREKKWNDEDTFLVSPDMGGIRRVKQLSEMLDNISYIALEKDRDLNTGRIFIKKIEQAVKKRAIIVDDMISTGSTIIQAANILAENKAEEIFVFATHPVLSKDASQKLDKSVVDKIFVTDTIDVMKEKKFPKLEVLSVAKTIASAIKIQNTKSEIRNGSTSSPSWV